MSAISSTVYSTLSNDATLTAMLATYGAGKAIFGTSPIQVEGDIIPKPYVHFDASQATPFINKSKISGYRWSVDLTAITANTGSEILVESMADRIAFLFNYTALTITGFNFVGSRVLGIRRAPTDHTLYGRIVMVEITATKT